MRLTTTQPEAAALVGVSEARLVDAPGVSRAEHATTRQGLKASRPRQIGLPGYGSHPLKGDQQGRWSISVTGAWRLTFRWESGDVLELDLEQYH
jgi:hypothetical protein